MTGRAAKAAPTTPAQWRIRSDAVRDAIADILRDNGNRWMSVSEIAHDINRRGPGQHLRGVAVSVPHVRRQTRNYSTLFERDGNMARLREAVEVEFIAENGHGAGVRLRDQIGPKESAPDLGAADGQ